MDLIYAINEALEYAGDRGSFIANMEQEGYVWTFQRRVHLGHLCPCHHGGPAGCGPKDGWVTGGQNLTRIPAKPKWIKSGSASERGEKKGQAGHRAPPVPDCGRARELPWRTTLSYCKRFKSRLGQNEKF